MRRAWSNCAAPSGRASKKVDERAVTSIGSTPRVGVEPEPLERTRAGRRPAHGILPEEGRGLLEGLEEGAAERGARTPARGDADAQVVGLDADLEVVGGGAEIDAGGGVRSGETRPPTSRARSDELWRRGM